MGSVYLATCNYKKVTPVTKTPPLKDHPSAHIHPSVGGIDLAEGALLVKFGASDTDDPTRRINELTGKFSCMKHECYACYTSAYYKCIEEYMHALFRNHRVENLLSRLRYKTKPSHPSQEHYAIPKDKMDTVQFDFEGAITKIEDIHVDLVIPCPYWDNCRLIIPAKGMENRIPKIPSMDKAK